MWALWRGTLHTTSHPLRRCPSWIWFSLAVFGQMTVGALSGFEYVAILAGECRSAARTIGQSVLISAPVICLMFILGTSSVLAFVGGQPINVIGPIPQTMRAGARAIRAAPGCAPFAIFLLIARAIAGSSLIFTGLTRLPMTAGWDHLVPRWFARWIAAAARRSIPSCLSPRWSWVLILLSMLGVREQEASQLWRCVGVHYAIAYLALFALPLVGALRTRVPAWLKVVSAAGFFASLISLAIAVYPIVNVVSRQAYATKIVSVVLLTNAAGILIFRAGDRRRSKA